MRDAEGANEGGARLHNPSVTIGTEGDVVEIPTNDNVTWRWNGGTKGTRQPLGLASIRGCSAAWSGVFPQKMASAENG
jgi:hypothetical protein